MRRLLAIPVLLGVSSIVVAFPDTRLGRAADRWGRELSHWASDHARATRATRPERHDAPRAAHAAPLTEAVRASA